MPEANSHPSREELSAYSLGQLPEERAVAIDSHISQCTPCCETIVDLASEDTFAGLLQDARQAPTDQTLDHQDSTSTSSSLAHSIPTLLAEHERYEIISLIGKGGMGDVYKAQHRKMERTVALKVINRDLVRKAEAVDRFHREVKTAAQLLHPNIVTAYDADQAGEYHFLVMEYVDGIDLARTVKDRGRLSIVEACDYIRQAATGLQHAHLRGMVHRDIKPHNLIVTADGTVKILDFGLASLAPVAVADDDTAEAHSDLTMAGAIMGTPDFISPEQADDARQADIRSDIYSLGATLYFLLAGRPPFAEGSVTQKLKSHAQAEPEPLESLRDDVPPELVAIVTKMTAKKPDDRFQTPAEVAEALKPFSESAEPREIVEPPTQAEPRRWKPAFVSLTAVAAMFVVAIVAGVIYYLQTDYGVIRVEVTDPSLQVTINNQTFTMKDEGGKTLTIRPGDQTLIVHKDDADFEFETDRFQIRRGDEVAFKVEILQGEIVVRKDGERFHSKALSDDIDARQILDRLEKAYAECKSYRDSGVIKFVSFSDNVSGESTVEYSFTTALVRPDQFRFEIKTEDYRLLIAANGENVQTWWDVEPGIQKPESLDSLEFAMAQAIGFTGGDVSRIPALLMPQKLETSGGLDLLDPKRIEDGKLQNVECFRLEYNFRDEQFTLWIDKQSYLIRRIDERIKLDRIRIERMTTFDPTIDAKITDKMLEFDPPARRADDDRADTLPDSALGSNDSLIRTAQERDADAVTRKTGQQRSDNQLEMPLCWCPAGEFKMGREQLPVTLTAGFWMGKYEVTQAQYEALMGENPSENKGESLPVEKVAWNEAKMFCQKFTELERKAGRLPKGWEYRLPTEAQWEYACRAGTALIWDEENALVYPSTFGNDLSELGDYAWYNKNSDGTPHPVGQKKPNAWGLCDMHGNMGEWVRDAWQSKLSGGKDPEADVWSPVHTRRGGDWFSSAEPCGSPFYRGIGVAGREVHMMGFRVALVPVGDSSDESAKEKPASSPRQPQILSEGDDNAALVYWQAFALLPELTGEDAKLLTDLEKGSQLGDDAKSLLTRGETALSLISRLQPDTPCRWELVEDGVNTLLPHLSKARMLAQLLVLQARVDAESGKTEAAVDRLIQAFIVARNVDEGVLVQMLVGDAIESLAADVALSLLPKLDASSCGRFAEALSKLPKRTTFARAMSYERELFGREAGTMLSEALEQTGQGKDSPAVQAIVTATMRKQEEWLGELLTEYDKVIEASKLPLAEANKELARLEAKVHNSTNPLIKLLMPSLVGTNQTHARVNARMAELETKLHDRVTAASEAAPSTDGAATDDDLPNTEPVNECEAIQDALRQHFMDKHPLFAASVNQRTKILSDLRNLGDMETRRQIGELAVNSPVSEVLNSFPGKPYVTFTEVTRAPGDEVNVVSVNLYRNADGTCRFDATKKERKKRAGEPVANGKPITEEEVGKLVQKTRRDRLAHEK